jgi:hypothetical protein
MVCSWDRDSAAIIDFHYAEEILSLVKMPGKDKVDIRSCPGLLFATLSIERKDQNMAAVHYHSDGEIAVLSVDNPPVNAFSHAVRVGLAEGLQRAAADTAIKALVIIGTGQSLIAGADNRE